MSLFSPYRQNIFISFLKTLGVRHTARFSEAYFNEHPHRHNLFGLSRMLSDYGVKNVGIQIKNKNTELSDTTLPFIANIHSDFAIVHKIDQNRVNYTWRGDNISVDRNTFNESWSGVALLAEADEDSIEPNYSEHHKKEILRQLTTLFTVVFFLLLGGWGIVSNLERYTPGVSAALIINIIGACVSYLLISKQIYSNSRYADKLCSLFKHNDCNDILQSSASKLWGIVSWSEIGWGYFISNVCLILFFPTLMPYLALTNICTLPYTFWSIWYQKNQAKQWCPLCLTVITTLWLLFINNFLFGLIQFPAWHFSDILKVMSLYLIPFLLSTLLISNFSKQNKITNLHHEINSLKANEDIFLALLKQQPKFEINRSTSKILFGDPNSSVLVSILTNPHCGPCSQLHKRIEKLLQETNNKLCIQYLFCSFSSKLDSSCHALIACYLNNSIHKAKEIFHEWYESGRNHRESFFTKFGFQTASEEVQHEFESHSHWKKTSGLHLTPTILVNGFKLPELYKIEDLKYFTDLSMDTDYPG